MNPSARMDLGPAQAQLSRRHLQSEEMLAICPGVLTAGQSGAQFTADGRQWFFLVTSRGGALTLALGSMELAADEIGVVHVKIVDRRANPPVARSPMHSFVYRGQHCLLQLPTVAELEGSGLIINDSLAITVSAHVFPSPPQKPSLLSKDLSRILESGEGGNVTFRVGDEEFTAHRTMIEARSPALAAVIPTIQATPQEAAIVIGGTIEPKAFGAFLKFLYTEDLPREQEILGELYTKETGCRMTEALFLVAERFDHEQVKGILEQRMIDQLDPSTAARVLSFAELHGRQHLQANCCRTVVTKGWLHEVIQSAGFGKLDEGDNYPTIAKDALLPEAGRALKRPRVTVQNPGT